MSFDLNHIKLAKLTYQLQKWQMVKVYSVSRKLIIQTPEKTKEFQFDFEYHLEHKGFHQMNHLINVSRKNFKINGQTPDMLIAKLTNEMQNGIYPIQLKIDPFGRWVGIANFEEIKANWKWKIEEIKKVHEGPGFENLVESFESGLENEQIFWSKMKEDSSLMYLFLPVYRHYGIIEKIEKDEMVYESPYFGSIQFSGDLSYSKEGNRHITQYNGKWKFNQVDLENWTSKLGLNSSVILKGNFVYKRETETYPFNVQSIQIEIFANEDLMIKEEIDYRFLRILT